MLGNMISALQPCFHYAVRPGNYSLLPVGTVGVYGRQRREVPPASIAIGIFVPKGIPFPERGTDAVECTGSGVVLVAIEILAVCARVCEYAVKNHTDSKGIRTLAERGEIRG